MNITDAPIAPESLTGKTLDSLISMVDAGIISPQDFAQGFATAIDKHPHLISYCVKKGLLSVESARAALGIT